MTPRGATEKLVSEFEGAELGDVRLSRRLKRVVEQLSASPASSFPELMTTAADREALYRFLSNEQVSLDGLLAPHARETMQRIVGPVVRIAHDTTSMVYGGDRKGLGSVYRKGQGFFAHCALAVAADETRRPLGVLGVRTFAHTKAKERRGQTASQHSIRCHRTPREEKLSSRWEKLAIATSAALPPGVVAVHVMDQEADDFAMLAALVEKRLRFVVRGSGTRLTAVAGASLRKVLAPQSATVFRKVRLSRRRNREQRSGRCEREAHLSIRWAPVAFQRPDYCKTTDRELALNVVHVFEAKPPTGDEPIEWFLLTTDPVTTLEEATAVVDHYRARWVVEEFFKALKTGCAIEKRQLSTYDALVRALGVFIPIAWHLLTLRNMADEEPTAAAREIFADEDLQLLRVLLRKRRSDFVFPKAPTVRDAMLAVAALGGHIRNNGDPGWLVLGRGFQTYVDAREVWIAARCDQS